MPYNLDYLIKLFWIRIKLTHRKIKLVKNENSIKMICFELFRSHSNNPVLIEPLINLISNVGREYSVSIIILY